jgi:MerR family transcriptional regulator, light-induced transcriptional regulator
MEEQAGEQLAEVGSERDVARPNYRDRALLKVVERHVLPRLVLRSPALASPQRFGDGLSERVPRMAELALRSDDRRSQALLHRLHKDGMSFSQLQLGLLAPTARSLNALWENDDVSFLDVTLATGNLQRMMRFVALDLIPVAHPRLRQRSILIAPAPGEGHGFGAAMAAEYFRRDGWHVNHDSQPTPESLADAAAAAWVDVVGLSVTADGPARALRETVRRVRRASINPRLLVIAAGEAIVRSPELLNHIGADATLAALETAPARAHRLVKALFGGGA